MMHKVPGTALTVGDLTRFPGLELQVIAGAGGLDRVLTWAHVCELEDPTPWLLGGELILSTGIALPRAAARQRAYLRRLDAAGVAGLALSDGLSVPPLTPAFRETAEELGFPVIEVPLPVPFISVVRAVAAAVHRDTSAQMTAQMQVFGTLRDVAFHEVTPQQLFDRLQKALGYELYLSTESGAPLLPDVAAPPPELKTLIPASPRRAPAVQGGFALPVPSPSGYAGYLLAIPKDSEHAPNLAALQSVSIVAAFLLSVRRQLEEVSRRQGAEILAELLGGNLDFDAVERRVLALGFDTRARYRLWALGRTEEVPEDAVADSLRSHDVEHLMLSQQAQHLLLCPDVRQVDAALRQIPRVQAGASRPFRLSPRLAVFRAEAVWALERAVETREPVHYFDGEPTDSWLTHDRATLADLVRGCLGPVIDYDRAHRSELLHTVIASEAATRSRA